MGGCQQPVPGDRPRHQSRKTMGGMEEPALFIKFVICVCMCIGICVCAHTFACVSVMLYVCVPVSVSCVRESVWVHTQRGQWTQGISSLPCFLR